MARVGRLPLTVRARRLPRRLFGYRRGDVLRRVAALEAQERGAESAWQLAHSRLQAEMKYEAERLGLLEANLADERQRAASSEVRLVRARENARWLRIGALDETQNLQPGRNARLAALREQIAEARTATEQVERRLRTLATSVSTAVTAATGAGTVSVGPSGFSAEAAQELLAAWVGHGEFRVAAPHLPKRVQARDGRVLARVVAAVLAGTPPGIVGFDCERDGQSLGVVSLADIRMVGDDTVVVDNDFRWPSDRGGADPAPAETEQSADLPPVQGEGTLPAGGPVLRLVPSTLAAREPDGAPPQFRSAAPTASGSPAGVKPPRAVVVSAPVREASAVVEEPPAATAAAAAVPSPEEAVVAVAPPVSGSAAEAKPASAPVGESSAVVAEPPAATAAAAAVPSPEEAVVAVAPPVSGSAAEAKPVSAPVGESSGVVEEPPAAAAAAAAVPSPEEAVVAVAPPASGSAAEAKPPSVPVTEEPPAQEGPAVPVTGEGGGAQRSAVDGPAPGPWSDPQLPPPEWSEALDLGEHEDAEITAGPAVAAAPQVPAPAAAVPSMVGGVATDVLAFLVGKVVGRELLDVEGRLVAERGRRIDAGLVAAAEAAGCLPELIVHMELAPR